MKTSTAVWTIVIVLVVILGGWYLISGMASSPTSASLPPVSTNTGLNNSPEQTNPVQQQVTPTPVVTIATDPKLGNHLVAASGMSLYVYSKDKANISNCTGTCATTWPPYAPATDATLALGDSTITGQLVTITRADGTTQLTYKGKPVYFYKNDVNPGDVKGQGVGGVWSVVKS